MLKEVQLLSSCIFRIPLPRILCEWHLVIYSTYVPSLSASHVHINYVHQHVVGSFFYLYYHWYIVKVANSNIGNISIPNRDSSVYKNRIVEKHSN